MTEVPVLDYDGMLMPAPKFYTPRNPDRPTLGGRRREFSRIWLGQPFMPWQQLVADVSGELEQVDGIWKPFYDLVVTTVQRQAGKTHLAFSKTAERCMSRPGWRAWYTAQTGRDARDAFLKFDEEQVDPTPLSRFVSTLKGNGHEVMKFRNTSTIRPHPPIEKALHGKQSDENDIDEGWAFDLESGNAMMQAIGPTQLTRPWAQTWVWSAGGTIASTWLARLVADGRGGAKRTTITEAGGETLRIAYFEWGIPDDLPLDDLELIARFHPAYGHTVSLDSIRKLRTILTDDGEFARAAGNRWTEVIGGAIPSELWKGARYSDVIPDEAPIAYGAARATDGSHAALAVAAHVGQLVVAEVLEVMPAYGAAGVIKEWLDGVPVACSPFGPSASLRDALTRSGVQLLEETSRDETAGVDDFLDGLKAGRYVFRHNEHLDAAVKVAGTRRVGDGGTQWARIKSGASIAALEAVSKAVWALEHKPAPAGKPVSRMAS